MFPCSCLLSTSFMSSFSTLRRFSLFTQQRFWNLHSSSNPHHNPKWGSAIVVASALTLFYCFSTPNSHFEFSNNAPRSSSPPLFGKSFLPESTHDHLLFGDAYRSKVFFNYEKRLREIYKEEFKKVMQSMQSHTRQGVQHMDGRQTGLRANASVENGELMEYLFGKDRKGRLTHDKFVQFIRDLQDETCL